MIGVANDGGVMCIRRIAGNLVGKRVGMDEASFPNQSKSTPGRESRDDYCKSLDQDYCGKGKSSSIQKLKLL